MSTVIYLANQHIQVIEGTRGVKGVNIKQCLMLEAPEGSIINGVITDHEAFTEFIKSAWSEAKLPTKDIILVVNSNKFIGRNLTMPKLNEKSTYEYIGREFAEVGRATDQIYSCIPVGNAENKMVRYYVEAVELDFVNDYVEVFNGAGLKLSAIYSDGNNLITLCANTAAKRNQTFLLLVADAMTMTTMLWVNGSFSYANSSRSFYDQGTAEYADDIARSVSQISQFMKANQIEAKLQVIEIAGVDSADMPMYKEAIDRLEMETPVSLFSFGSETKGNGDLQRYLQAISGLYGTVKSQNFLTRASASKKKHKENAKVDKVMEVLKLFLPAFIVFVVLAIVVIAMFIVKTGKQKQLDALNEYNEDPLVMMDVSRYDSVLERNAFLLAQYKAIKEIDEDIVTYPCGNSEVLDMLGKSAAGYAEINSNSFDARNGTLSFTAEASEVDLINKFIRRLMDEKIFCEVNYTGYEHINGEDRWKINITCTLAESAGRGVTVMDLRQAERDNADNTD